MLEAKAMTSKKKIAIRTASAFALSILVGCATPPAQEQRSEPQLPKAQPSAPPPPGFKEKMAELVENDPLFAAMAAELAAQQGDLTSATVAYTEAAKFLKDPELAKRAVELTLSAGNAELALEAAKIWAELDSNDDQASRSVMLLQLSTNRVEEALPSVKQYIKKLQEQEDNHPGVSAASPLKVLMDLMLRIPDKSKAYQTTLSLIGNNPEITEEQYVLSQLADAADLPNEAINHLEKVLNKVPEERYNILMAQYMEKRDGNTDSAVEFLAARADRNPDWFSARLYLARVYTQQNNWQLAFERFKELIRLQPTNYALYSSQGFVLTKLEKRKEAERHFNIYLDKTPPPELQNEMLIYISMADLYQKEKNFDGALKWLGKAQNADQNLDIQLKIHDLYEEQGKASEAAAVLERFQPQNEEDTVRLTLALSQFVEKIKQPDRAIKVLENALDEYPDQEDLLYERAMVAERQKDLPTVERYLKRLIEVKPQNPHGYNALGYTFAELGVRLDEALVLIKKANSLAPRDPYILDSLGWVYFKLGQFGLAEEALLKAFDIRQDEEIGAHLLELYIKQGRKDDAMAMLTQLKAKYPNSSELERLAKQANEIEL